MRRKGRRGEEEGKERVRREGEVRKKGRRGEEEGKER